MLHDMTRAYVFPPGGFLADIRSTMHAMATGIDDLAASVGKDDPTRHESEAAPDPYADEPKWPAWKVTLAVVVFCGAFWAGIGYLAFRLLG
jgi:hypothetical protein